MSVLEDRIDALDTDLFNRKLSGASVWDRRALLGLHAAVATCRGAFDYLEIGSYLGGSLQVLVRDRRCRSIVSIDPRPLRPPDKRSGTWEYEDNSTAGMLELLASLEEADISKIATFEVGTDALRVDQLPSRPSYCFIDGEHTDTAVLRDARFCAQAIQGHGVIAFHDYQLLRPGIATFLREIWSEVTLAIAFADLVFAVEVGGTGILQMPVIDRAIGSGWHRLVWRSTSRSRSVRPLLLAWSVIPTVDGAVAGCRMRFQRAELPSGRPKGT